MAYSSLWPQSGDTGGPEASSGRFIMNTTGLKLLLFIKKEVNTLKFIYFIKYLFFFHIPSKSYPWEEASQSSVTEHQNNKILKISG